MPELTPESVKEAEAALQCAIKANEESREFAVAAVTASVETAIKDKDLVRRNWRLWSSVRESLRRRRSVGGDQDDDYSRWADWICASVFLVAEARGLSCLQTDATHILTFQTRMLGLDRLSTTEHVPLSER